MRLRLRSCRGAWLAALLVAIPGVAAAQCAHPPQPLLPKKPLAIETAGGVQAFSVEIALGPEEMACGLMLRQRLGADEGMLFDYGRDREVAMWMENTVIPLDMIFIDGDGKVAFVARRTTPFSRQTIVAPMPVRAVLEVAAGTADRLGIRPGDRVRSSQLGT